MIWQRILPPHMESEWNDMNCKNANVVLQHYEQEIWHVSATDIVKRLETQIQRTIAKIRDFREMVLTSCNCILHGNPLY